MYKKAILLTFLRLQCHVIADAHAKVGTANAMPTANIHMQSNVVFPLLQIGASNATSFFAVVILRGVQAIITLLILSHLNFLEDEPIKRW